MKILKKNRNQHSNLQTFLSKNLKESEQNLDIPPPIFDWLRSLSLLKGIPFHYLVPDRRMLPKESIRFFYINPEWVEALIMGACSIGLLPQDEMQNTQAFAKALQLAIVKKEVFLTGVLIRSPLVSGWEGLEVIPYSDKAQETKPLKVVRREKLANDVLLVIADGEMESIVVKEPLNQMHFEVKEDSFKDGLKSSERIVNLKKYLDKGSAKWASEQTANIKQKVFILKRGP